MPALGVPARLGAVLVAAALGATAARSIGGPPTDSLFVLGILLALIAGLTALWSP